MDTQESIGYWGMLTLIPIIAGLAFGVRLRSRPLVLILPIAFLFMALTGHFYFK